MDKRLPGGRFRIFLAVLGICLTAGIVLSYFEQGTVAGPRGESGTLEKLIVADGNVAMNIDLSRLDGAGNASLRFNVVPDSLFTVVVFNNELRGSLPSSMEIRPQNNVDLPGRLRESYRQLSIESVFGGDYEFVVRDAKTGFTYFGVEGLQLNYTANDRSMNFTDGRLVIASEFARALGHSPETRTVVGDISINANMRPVEVTQVDNGDVTSSTMPPIYGSENGTNPGPDVVVGDLTGLIQNEGQSGTQVGLSIGTDACNYGVVDLNWFAMPNTDHPVIPQNLYRMSGGPTNNDKFEQIGQSQMKHAFTALTGNICGLGCNGVGGSRLGSGCSDPYGAGLNGGPNLGSRAWVNPWTGVYPSTANNHSGHSHTSTGHRLRTEVSDLANNLNPGATYWGEAQYVTPHEYNWCSQNQTCIPGSGYNTFNNVSYRRFNVSGNQSPFSFSFGASTVRQQPAINAWTGATIVRVEPDPGNDGLAFIAYKVTNPSAGVWHYEYAIYNQNLDRGIQAFSLPAGNTVTKSNVDFHAPPQHPGWANNGTFQDQPYSSTPWTLTETPYASQWAAATFAQDQNANAVRWGTMYNIRFDSDREPSTMFATVSFFKTGNPVSVQVQGPSNPSAPWPCTSRRRNGVPIPNCG